MFWHVYSRNVPGHRLALPSEEDNMWHWASSRTPGPLEDPAVPAECRPAACASLNTAQACGACDTPQRCFESCFLCVLNVGVALL